MLLVSLFIKCFKTNPDKHNITTISDYMKKTLFVAFMLSCILVAHAQNSLNIGYCGGKFTEEATMKIEGANWVEGAIYLPAERIKVYAGAEMTSVRVALANRIGLDTLKVWVRTKLDDKNITEGMITTKTSPAIKQGWNEIDLENPYTIKDGEGVYVGFSFYQRKTANPMSILNNVFQNAFFLRSSQNLPWEDMHEKGMLSLEAVVEGDALPEYDLALTNATIKSGNNVLSMKASIYNAGLKTVKGFDLKTIVQGIADSYSKHFEMELSPKQIVDVEFPLPYDCTEATPVVPVELCISALQDATDANSANNELNASYSFTKKVLLEEFTSVYCGNCPTMAYYIEEALKDDKYNGNVFVACHHSGFHYDRFTNEADKEYLWFYNNNGSTFAPGLMSNRTPFVMRAGGMSPVWIASSVTEVKEVLNQQIASDTYAAITKLEGIYDAVEETLKVNLNGVRSKIFCDTPARITVYLTEDGIDGSDQKNFRPNEVYPNGTFKHNHVVRAYNSTWGENIDWKNDAFDYTFTFPVNNNWVKSNLKVIAFIAAYDETDPGNCRIENVDGISFQQVSGVENVIQDQTSQGSVGVYTLNGQKVQSVERGHGVLIVREKTLEGNIVTRKIIK